MTQEEKARKIKGHFCGALVSRLEMIKNIESLADLIGREVQDSEVDGVAESGISLAEAKMLSIRSVCDILEIRVPRDLEPPPGFIPAPPSTTTIATMPDTPF